MSVADKLKDALAPQRSAFGSAVKDGILRYLSVSQIKQFMDCERLWKIVKVDKVPLEEKPWQSAGTDAHTRLEHLLTTGEDVLGEVEGAGRALLPAPLTVLSGLLLEWGLDNKPRPRDATGKHVAMHDPAGSVVRAAGVPLVGFVDCLNERGTYVDPDGVTRTDPDGTIEVIDHKTTSDIASWAKQARELPTDPQMQGYGILAQYRGARHVRFSHIYYQTGKKGRDAAKRTVLVSVADNLEAWYKTSQIAQRMADVARDPGSAVPNFGPACDKYRGCPFRGTEHCRRPRAMLFSEVFSGSPTGSQLTQSNPSSTEQVVGGNTMSLLAKLQAKANMQATGPAAPAIPPAPAAPTPAPTPAPARMLIEDQSTTPDRPVQAPPPSPPVMSPALPKGTATIESPVPLTVGAVTADGHEVLADLTGGVYLVKLGAPKPAVLAAPAPTAQATPAPTETAPVEPAPAAQAAPAVPAAPKRGRGRPPKAPTPPAPVETAPAAQAAPTAADDPTPSLTDVIAGARPLAGYVADLAGTLAEHFKCDDIRSSDHEALKFSKWKGVVAAAVKEVPPDPGAWFVTGGDDLTNLVLETLKPIADSAGVLLLIGCVPAGPGVVLGVR